MCNPQVTNQLKILQDIFSPFQNDTYLTETDLHKLISQIEMSVRKKAITEASNLNISASWINDDFLIIYSKIFYKIYMNLDPNSSIESNYLLLNILNHVKKMYLTKFLPKNIKKIIFAYLPSIKPKELINLSPEKLNPYSNQEYFDQINLRMQQKVNIKVSHMYKCNNCGQRQTRAKPIQTRSLDEGNTIFIVCLYCQNRWSQRG